MKNKQSLYNKYRPLNFDQVIGQKIAKSILKNSIAKNKINHAYLFYGIRGTGKTTLARIFAKAVNCEDKTSINPCNKCDSCNFINNFSSYSVIEIDAASNNGVDEIRLIRENATYLTPQGGYKVYIIDEVHMLTRAAFNAILKILEEPPENTIFLLVTTEIQKIPETVLSRTLIINLEVMSDDDIKSGMKVILNGENVDFEEESLDYISMISGGSMRDAISYIEASLLFDSVLSVDNVIKSLGLIRKDEIKKMLKDKDFKLINIISETDKDPRKISFILMEVLMELIEENNFEFIDILNKLIEYNNTIKDLSLLRAAIKSCFYKIIVPHETISKNKNIKTPKTYVKTADSNQLEIITDYVNVNNYIYIIKKNNIELLDKIQKRWRYIDNYISYENYKDVVLTLSRTNVLATTDKTLIVGFHNESQINEFKRISLTQGLFDFIKEVLGDYKFILPINSETWGKLISVKESIKLENIHQDITINISDFIKNDSDKMDEKISDLFGKDNISYE